MGYGATVRDQLFHIHVTKKADALQRIKQLKGAFMWVYDSAVRAAKTLEDMFAVWGWTLKVDGTGTVYGIEFDREKLGNEDLLFKAVAPCVKAGSYIAMTGEDGEIWRWFFNGKTCVRQHAVITWSKE